MGRQPGEADRMRGSVFKRGKSWTVVISLPKGPDGKRRQVWRTVQGTRKDAERERTRLLHEVNNGGFVEPAKLTVGELLDRWLGHAKSTVRGTTHAKYEEVARVYLKPHLGHVVLPKLTPLVIQTAYSKLLETGRRGGRPLSARSVQHAHAVLHRALTMAVKWRLLAVNPADAVEAPRPTRRHVEVLDEAETRDLLSAAEGTAWHLPLLLAATTGARRSELLGLRWRDLDLDNGRMAIRQALTETKDGGVAFTPPKSGKPRVVSLPAVAANALRLHRAEQEKERAAAGSAYRADLDLVLPYPGTNGEPWAPESFTSGYRAWARRRGVSVKFHALRHGHASHLLRAGVSLKVVSTRLGHSTVSLTGDLYAHLLGGEDEAAAAKLDAVLQRES